MFSIRTDFNIKQQSYTKVKKKTKKQNKHVGLGKQIQMCRKCVVTFMREDILLCCSHLYLAGRKISYGSNGAICHGLMHCNALITVGDRGVRESRC